MSTTSCEPVRTAAETSAPAELFEPSHASIDALPLPCALSDQNDGAMPASNQAFVGEFMPLREAPDHERFIAAFDSLGEGEDGVECHASQTRRWSDGLGMGLAICRSIMEFHDDHLFAAPDAEGGRSFAFTRPAESA